MQFIMLKFIHITLVVLLLSLATPLLSAQHRNLPAEKRDIIPTTNYVIYLPWGTLPTLYSAIHMQLHNKPSFLWFYRDGTLDTEFLPSNVTLMGTPGDRESLPLVRDKIAQIIATEPNASFTLFTDDMQSGRIALTMLVANGVKSGNYQVRILSDGSGTYNFYKNLFNVAGGGLDTYNNASLYYFSLWRRAGVGQNSRHIPQSNLMWADLANQMFALASYPFTEMWLSYPDLLTSDDFRMGLARMQINTRVVDPQFLFSTMSKAQSEAFLKVVGFSRSYYDNLLKIRSRPTIVAGTPTLDDTASEEIEITPEEPVIIPNGAKNKNKLIITISDPIPRNFNSILTKIIKDYHNDYDIFLKPHPNAAPSDLQIAQYKKLGIIEVLPGRMPMEVLLWTYPHIKLGGYQSSLYMATVDEQVLFFISNGHYDLPEPLFSLYQQGGFNNVRFYTRL
jgi:hypothetical protein